MKCGRCENETTIKRGTYHYTESGLDNVYLQNIEMRVCESCDCVTPRISRINELHSLIGRAVALKGESLSGDEARFLRKHLGLKAREWASLLHVDVSTLSRWESGEQVIGPQSDVLIRFLYFHVLKERHGQQAMVFDSEDTLLAEKWRRDLTKEHYWQRVADVVELIQEKYKRED